tara:strand:- start:284 stop:529 length:246 start_codon:yes stop_codon:yes gene_type:complete
MPDGSYMADNVESGMDLENHITLKTAEVWLNVYDKDKIRLGDQIRSHPTKEAADRAAMHNKDRVDQRLDCVFVSFVYRDNT